MYSGFPSSGWYITSLKIMFPAKAGAAQQSRTARAAGGGRIRERVAPLLCQTCRRGGNDILQAEAGMPAEFEKVMSLTEISFSSLKCLAVRVNQFNLEIIFYITI